MSPNICPICGGWTTRTDGKACSPLCVKRACDYCKQEHKQSGVGAKYCKLCRKETQRLRKMAARRCAGILPKPKAKDNDTRWKRAAGLLEKFCKRCDKQFLPKVYHQKFCSNRCQRIANGQIRQFGPRNCSECKKLFIPGGRSRRQLTCSPACSKARARRVDLECNRRKAAARVAARVAAGDFDYRCAVCGQEFRYNRGGLRKKYCSSRCKGKAKREAAKRRRSTTKEPPVTTR